MRVITVAVALSLSFSSARAQALITRDSITTNWAYRHLIGGIDSPAPHCSGTFACVRSWPEVTNVLIAIYRDPASVGLARADAILVLGGTGQDSAFAFLVHTLDLASATDHERQDMLLALGNSANPPGFVYEHLEAALSSTILGDATMAAMALDDIGFPRALQILQSARGASTSRAGIASIDRNLARFRNRKARVIAPRDSTMLRGSLSDQLTERPTPAVPPMRGRFPLARSPTNQSTPRAHA